MLKLRVFASMIGAFNLISNRKPYSPMRWRDPAREGGPLGFADTSEAPTGAEMVSKCPQHGSGVWEGVPGAAPWRLCRPKLDTPSEKRNLSSYGNFVIFGLSKFFLIASNR
jgi:hypothetical protein